MSPDPDRSEEGAAVPVAAPAAGGFARQARTRPQLEDEEAAWHMQSKPHDEVTALQCQRVVVGAPETLWSEAQRAYIRKHLVVPRGAKNVFLGIAVGKAGNTGNPTKGHHATLKRKVYEDYEDYLSLASLRYATRDAAKFGQVFQFSGGHAIKTQKDTPLNGKVIGPNGIKANVAGDHLVKTLTHMIYEVDQAKKQQGDQVMVWHEYLRREFDGDYVMATYKSKSAHTKDTIDQAPMTGTGKNKDKKEKSKKGIKGKK